MTGDLNSSGSRPTAAPDADPRVIPRRRLGIRQKLAGVVTALLAFAFVLIAFALQSRVRLIVGEGLVEKAESLCTQMARAGAPALREGSERGLEDVLRSVRSDRDVVRTGFFTEDGTLIASFPPGPWPLTWETPDEGTCFADVDGESVLEVRTCVRESKDELTPAQKIGAARPPAGEDRVLGIAALILHRDRERSASADALFFVLPLLCLSLVLVLLGVVAATRSFLAPLSQVTDALRGVSRAELDQHLEVEAQDEVGEVATVLNQVTHDLRRFKLVSDHRRNLLQKRVERRTGELHETRRYLESVIQNTSEGIITLDLAGDVVRLNQAASKVLGQPADAVLGRPVPIFADIDLPNLLRHFRAGGESTKLVIGVSHKTHGRRLVVNFSPIRGMDGRPEGLTAILVDRTAENLAMEKIVQANERLRHLDRMKDAFISSVSHEFRTPLASIKAFVEILLLYPEERAQNMDEFLGIINSEVDRLSDMVESLLDLSKLRAGAAELTRTAVDPLVLVREAGRRLQPLLTQRSLNLVVEPSLDDVQMLGDHDRLLQVLLNLIGNARKFAPLHGKIRVRWQALPDEIEMEVADNGPGVPQEKINELFERFRQVSGDHLTDRPAGTGLGLAISKEIVHAHGGSIRAFRSELGGLAIAFRIPSMQAGEPIPEMTTTRRVRTEV